MRILVLTACSGNKKDRSMPAYKLYRSSRIKAVYNRRCGHDMGILSAQYGLVNAQNIIEPYERVMNEKRALELVPSVVEKVEDYDCVVFFKGGARKAYVDCIKDACRKAKKQLITLGFANMGGINDLPTVIGLAEQKKSDKIEQIERARVFFSA